MKMKTLRGAGTASEFYGANSMGASQIGGLGKDHQINRSRLVKSLIRKAARVDLGRAAERDEEYVETIKSNMLTVITNPNKRKTIIKFMENILNLRAGYRGMVKENGAGTYTLYGRRQTVYENEDAHVGVHFRPEGWTAEDGGKGMPKNAYRSYRLVDEDLNNDDWLQLAPMMEEMLSISGLLTDLNSRAYAKNQLERERKVHMQLKQDYHAVDWEDEQRKDDEIQAWLDSAPSHAQLNHVAGSENTRFRVLRGKRPTAEEIESRKRQIEWKESIIKEIEEGLTKQLHLDHLDLDSLKGAEALKWNQIVDTVFGIRGEEE